jgi:hypothetical protein
MLKASPHSLCAAAALTFAVYALVLVAAPVFHHEGPLRAPSATHCVVCAAVEAVASVVEPLLPPPHDLSDAGAVVPVSTPCHSAAPVSPRSGRAPPASPPLLPVVV